MRVATTSFVLLALLAACGAQSEEEQAGSPRTVVGDLRESGLPVGRTETYNASSDPNKLLGRPGQYVSKANFRVRGIPDDKLNDGIDVSEGGGVEIFDDEDAASKREEYIKAIAESGGLFAEYTYRDGLVVLRLSSELTPDRTAEFEKALNQR